MDVIIISFIGSFLLAFLLIPVIRKWQVDKDLLYEDMNKPEKPRVPGMGGLAISAAFVITVTALVSVVTILDIADIDLSLVFPALLSVMLMVFVGLMDDILVFPFRSVKPVLALVAAIPMLAVFYHVNLVIDLPFLPEIQMGCVYPLVVIPLLVVFGANAVNIMADFDGLSPGNGMIMAAALFACAFIANNPTAMLLLAGLLGCLIIFYFYNKYPAKMFAGNIGTLFIGATLAVSAIIGDMKLPFIILMVPYLVHLVLQERYALHEGGLSARPRERGQPQPDGTIKSQYQKSYGLTHFIMLHCKKVTEKRLVCYLMLFELIFAIIAVIIQLNRYHFIELYG